MINNVYTDEHKDAERRMRDAIGDAFKCQVHSFGQWFPIDCWASRDGRVVAWIEIKCRTQTFDAYPTVWLSFRKWLELTVATQWTGVPTFFAVGWADASGLIKINDVDPRKMLIGGREDRGGEFNDIEPMIDVPVDAFTLFDRTAP